MSQSELDAVRQLLGSKPRPAGWAERRRRLDEVGSFWPAAEDVKFTPVDLGGVPGEWSIAPRSDQSSIFTAAVIARGRFSVTGGW
jgi:epsilon-lactone hydrolase